ncbi:hypothetical protein C8J56DRAFT_1023563 [Mycena floridula]|nr:hypothetical protein C8J56DRAFT_1023563 [Mycena floridula]
MVQIRITSRFIFAVMALNAVAAYSGLHDAAQSASATRTRILLAPRTQLLERLRGLPDSFGISMCESQRGSKTTGSDQGRNWEETLTVTERRFEMPTSAPSLQCLEYCVDNGNKEATCWIASETSQVGSTDDDSQMDTMSDTFGQIELVLRHIKIVESAIKVPKGDIHVRRFHHNGELQCRVQRKHRKIQYLPRRAEPEEHVPNAAKPVKLAKETGRQRWME